jgi:glyoxylate carboligase
VSDNDKPRMILLTGEALQRFVDDAARRAHGMTKAEAHAQGICIACKQPPPLSTDADRREYAVSALCGACFDASIPPEED